MTDKIKNSLNFVVRHYRPDAFKSDTSFIRSRATVRCRWIAAAAIGGVLLASAAALTYIQFSQKTPEAAPAPVQTQPAAPQLPDAAPDTMQVKRIEFTDASLAKVVEQIETTYGVKVSGLDPQDTNRLTLSYEGNAADLIETINSLLGTNLSIEA